MARPHRHAPLAIHINGRLVAELRKESSGEVGLQYNSSWLNWKHAFPISLSLPLQEDRYQGDVVNVVLENLLPENSQTRQLIAERGGTRSIDAFSVLSLIGGDCIGALQFTRQSVLSPNVKAVDGDPITDQEIRALLVNLESTPFGFNGESEFRTTLSGSRNKLALLYMKNSLQQNTWFIPGHGTATTHIIKPQDGSLDYVDYSQRVENEFLCMQFLLVLGLPVAHTWIDRFAGQKALVIERFDRHWSKQGKFLRVPQEDICQALSIPLAQKYESEGGPGTIEILRFLKGSDDPENDQRMFLYGLCVFWLLGIVNGHGKKFSVFLQPGGGFKLTPFYGIVSGQPWVDDGNLPRKRMTMAMAVGNKHIFNFDQIVPQHFVESAESVGVRGDVVRDILQHLRSSMPLVIKNVIDGLPLGYPVALRNAIVNGVRRRLGLIPAA